MIRYRGLGHANSTHKMRERFNYFLHTRKSHKSLMENLMVLMGETNKERKEGGRKRRVLAGEGKSNGRGRERARES